MSTIRFEIRYTDGRSEAATVEGERALIGSAAHCDVRLPLDQAAAEHIAVEVVGDTVRVETKAFEPAATINGMPFTAMPINADMPLRLGATRIFISLIDVGTKRTGPVAQRSEDSGSPLIRVLGLVGVAAGVYVFLPTEEVHAPPPVEVPQLFAGPAASCEQKAPDQAHAQALSLLDSAETERERSPFVARDGLQAVQLYELGAACLRQAGATAEADGAQRSADELKDAITLDFRARRVRLEHMLAVGDYEMAGKDVAVLRELTVGRRGPWISWLAGTDQMLKQKGVGK
jgi:hypothetical protein